MRVIAYARKSTEQDDRQILSIDVQLRELQEYATNEQLEIVLQRSAGLVGRRLPPARGLFSRRANSR